MMMYILNKRISWVLLVFITQCALYACKSGSATEQPVSSAEAREFSVKLKQSVTRGGGKLVDEMIQSPVFYNRIVQAEPGETPVKLSKSDFKRLFREMRLGQRMSEAVGPEGMFEELRAYVKNNKHHLLYRMYAEDGMNYYDFELSKVNGRVVIADIFVYLSGQNISETARELVVQVVNTKTKLTSENERKAEKIKEMRRLLQGEKYKEVIEIVDGLPASWKKVRVFLIQKLIAASRYETAAFEQAREEFERYFPGEQEKMGLMLLDGYVMQGKLKESLKCINDLDRQLGGDPLLDLQRGVLHYQDSQPDSAVFYLERLTGKMPRFSDGNAQLVNVYMLTGKKKEAKALLDEYVQDNRISSKAVQSLEEAFPELAKK